MQSVPSPWPRPVIFADRGCPFSHRVLALLHHLGVEPERREAQLGQLPEGLGRWSPSGRIPLLVHGPLVVGDSRVILEHLAEAYGFDAAYPRALEPRSSQRHAMALLDAEIAPTLIRERADLGAARLAECVDVLEAVARLAPPEPSLLVFHVAPVWLRLQWWHPVGPATRAIGERPELATWLDAAARVEAVARTAPSEAENVADFLAAMASRRSAGR